MDRDIIFEHILIGSSVKVTAFDTQTGIEVSTITPVALSQDLQKQAAYKKLIFVLERTKVI